MSGLESIISGGPVLADGGMGTSLIALGVPIDACLDSLNEYDPALVESVHRACVEAGSRMVLANTFGANRFKLARHGLAERAAELNRRGVEVARRAGALVGGSAGPLGVRLAPYGRVSLAEAEEVYAEQIAALAEAGVDLIVIETQSDLTEMERALAAARDACDLPVVVTATFTRDDRTLLGSTPEQVADRLSELGADGIGANCSEGPAQVLRVVRAMRPHARGTPLVAQPNAGAPRQVGGRLVYEATPEYFAQHAAALRDEGVAIIGGCCGTGAAHIGAMARALTEPSRAAVEVVPSERPVEEHGRRAAPTELSTKLAEGRFVVAVEMDPPRGFSAAKLLAGAETFAEAGADVIDVADSPMARMRMSPWAACRLIMETVGIETVLHFPTRGRNLLRLQGDLLAVHALGIRNVFVCLGDPVEIGDFPAASGNVDVAPTGVMRLITRSFNEGHDQAGHSIGESTSFVVGCAVSPGAPDLEAEVRLLKRKVDAGAGFALSQPVYSLEPLEKLRAAYEERHGELLLPLLAGVLPLAGSRHAEYLHNEVPGIVVPADALDRMRRAGDRGEQEGLRMASDLARELRESSAGIYLMPQFGRFDIAAEVAEAARG